MDATAFITQLQQEMTAASQLDAGLRQQEVNILKKTTAGLEFLLSSHSQSHSTCCGSKVRSASWL